MAFGQFSLELLYCGSMLWSYWMAILMILIIVHRGIILTSPVIISVHRCFTISVSIVVLFIIKGSFCDELNLFLMDFLLFLIQLFELDIVVLEIIDFFLHLSELRLQDLLFFNNINELLLQVGQLILLLRILWFLRS